MGLAPIELLVLLTPLLLVAGVVLLLVVVSARPSATLTSEVATARRHAITTSALSALVTVLSVVPVGIALAASVHEVHAGVACLPLAATAVALLVLLVGELTWPRPGGASRVALLRDRTVIGLLRGAWPAAASTSAAVLVLTLVVTGSVAYGGRAIRHVRPDGASTASPFPGWTYGVAQLVALVLVVALALLTVRAAALRAAVVTADADTDDLLRRASAARVFRAVLAGATVTLGADLAVAGSATHNAFDAGDVHGLGVALVVVGPLLVLAGLLALAVPVPRLRPAPSATPTGAPVAR